MRQWARAQLIEPASDIIHTLLVRLVDFFFRVMAVGESQQRHTPMTDPTEALSETAKAVREVAKFGGSTIDAGRKAAVGWTEFLAAV